MPLQFIKARRTIQNQMELVHYNTVHNIRILHYVRLFSTIQHLKVKFLSNGGDKKVKCIMNLVLCTNLCQCKGAVLLLKNEICVCHYYV